MNDAKCQHTENKKRELKKDRLTREIGFIEDIELIRVCGMLIS